MSEQVPKVGWKIFSWRMVVGYVVMRSSIPKDWERYTIWKEKSVR